MKAYGLQVGVSQSRIDEVISCVLDSWDDTMVREYLSSVGEAHKACRLNPHTDYTDATLKQRMAQQVAGKSEGRHHWRQELRNSCTEHLMFAESW